VSCTGRIDGFDDLFTMVAKLTNGHGTRIALILVK
jgi:hypothetical protein